jgi:hypothetical protein
MANILLLECENPNKIKIKKPSPERTKAKNNKSMKQSNKNTSDLAAKSSSTYFALFNFYNV